MQMKQKSFTRAILSAIILWMCAAYVHAAPPALLTSLQAIHQLSNAQASQELPVAFEATVTYYRTGNVDLFVQDGDTAIYVETSAHAQVKAGDRVLIQGKTRDSFRPEISSDAIPVLRHGDLPRPVPATFSQLISAELDCRRV